MLKNIRKKISILIIISILFSFNGINAFAENNNISSIIDLQNENNIENILDSEDSDDDTYSASDELKDDKLITKVENVEGDVIENDTDGVVESTDEEVSESDETNENFDEDNIEDIGDKNDEDDSKIDNNAGADNQIAPSSEEDYDDISETYEEEPEEDIVEVETYEEEPEEDIFLLDDISDEEPTEEFIEENVKESIENIMEKIGAETTEEATEEDAAIEEEVAEEDIKETTAEIDIEEENTEETAITNLNTDDIAENENTNNENNVEETRVGSFLNNLFKNNELVGAAPGKEKIILDCGIGPGLEKSNWGGTTALSALTNVDNKYSTEEYPGGTLVKNIFPDVPTEKWATEDHVLLPTFPDKIWAGYIFKGWKDSIGNDATEFLNSFQYEGEDSIYTAIWEEDLDYKVRYFVEHLHKDAAPGDRVMIATETSAENYVGNYIIVEPKEIQGYKVCECEIKHNKKILSNGMEDDFSGMISVNASDYLVSGSLPNQDVYITYIYEPITENSGLTLKINHVNVETGIDIADPDIINNVPAEQIITAKPAAPGFYKFLSVEIVPTSTVESVGIYPLGTYEISEGVPYELNTTTGEFKAKMPNQELEINYKYTYNLSFNIDVRVEEIFEGKETIVSTKSITFGKSNEYEVKDYTSDGYGFPPFITSIGDNLVFSYNTSTKKIKYSITGPGDCTIKISYSYDTNLPSWHKINFIAENGTLQVESGYKDISNRFYLDGTYTIEELTNHIVAVPNTDYVFDGWYKAADIGTGKVGEKYKMDDEVTITSDFKLYANFISKNIKLTFMQGDNGILTGGIVTIEVSYGSLWADIVFPTITPSAGYSFVGWKDTNNNLFFENDTTIKIESVMTYVSVCEIEDDGKCIKPIANVISGGSYKGEAKLYGTKNRRKYCITDENGIIKEVKSGSEIKNKNFTNLIPGTYYYIYEVAMDQTLTVNTNISTVPSNKISQPEIVGVKSLYNNFSVSTDMSAINITPKVMGAEYALLDRKYNIVKDFGETFSGLTDASYYLVVAREEGSSKAADDQSLINLGVPVYMYTNNTSTRTYKLIVYGGSDPYHTTSESTSECNVYDITAGTSVTIDGEASGRVWEVLSGDIKFVSPTTKRQNFTMPESDVVVRNRTDVSVANNSKMTIINNGYGLYVRNTKELILELNSSSNASSAISEGLDVEYYIIFDKKGTNKSDLNGVTSNNKKLSPQSIDIKLGMTIAGEAKEIDTETLNKLNIEVSLSFDEGMIGNIDYQLYKNASLDTMNVEYSCSTDASIQNYCYFTINPSDVVNLSYLKTYKVNVQSENTGSTIYNEDFMVPMSEHLYDAANYDNLDRLLSNGFLIDLNGSTAVSNYNADMYLLDNIYNGAIVFDVDNTAINKPLNLKLKYDFDIERDKLKKELNKLINDITKKVDTDPLYQYNIATITDALNIGNDIKNDQINKTTDEIEETIAYIKNVISNLTPLPLQYVDISFDGNGGTLSEKSLHILVGESLAFLDTIKKEYEGHEFKSWNMSADGKGKSVTSKSKVTLSMDKITIYAIWDKISSEEEEKEKEKKIIGTGGYVTGGGGGGGGGSVTIPISEQLFNGVGLIAAMSDEDKIDDFAKDTTKSNFALNNIKTFTDFDGILFVDPANKVKSDLYFLLNNLTFEKNSWVKLTFTGNSILHPAFGQGIYKFGPDAIAVSGLYTEGNNVYYLSKDKNVAYCQLKTGWIYDEGVKKWYYGDKNNGALAVGWRDVDGLPYYFNTNYTVDSNGNLDVNNFNYGNGYGQLLTNTITPDGWFVNEDGLPIQKVK